MSGGLYTQPMSNLCDWDNNSIQRVSMSSSLYLDNRVQSRADLLLNFIHFFISKFVMDGVNVDQLCVVINNIDSLLVLWFTFTWTSSEIYKVNFSTGTEWFSLKRTYQLWAFALHENCQEQQKYSQLFVLLQNYFQQSIFSVFCRSLWAILWCI